MQYNPCQNSNDTLHGGMRNNSESHQAACSILDGQHHLLKKSETGDLKISHLSLYYRAIVTKTSCYWSKMGLETMK